MSVKLFVRMMPLDVFENSLPKATEILSTHIKDVPYVALALSLQGRGYEIRIWSNEKQLKTLEKHGINVISTSELVEELSL